MIDQIHGPDVLLKCIKRASGDVGDVVVFARYSSPNGKVAATFAVDDGIDAVEALRQRTGLDVRGHLPARELMIEALRLAPAEVSTFEGRRFTNRYYIAVDVPGVLVVLSIGSARKEDDEFNQPAVRRVCEIVLARKAVLLFARRVDRSLRLDVAHTDYIKVLRRTKGCFGTEEHFFDVHNAGDVTFLGILAQNADLAARTIVTSTRNGWRRKTGQAMSKGWVQIGLPLTPPPGFARIRMAGEQFNESRSRLYLDSPLWLPPPSKVAMGYPEVRDSKNRRVCQVSNVRFAIERIADGTPYSKIAKLLIDRRYSTDALRRKLKDPAGRWTLPPGEDPEAPVRLLYPIIGAFDLFETGRITFHLNVEGSDREPLPPITINGCFPPDTNRWIDLSILAAARLRVAESPMRPPILYSFAGLKVTVCGTTGVLRSRQRPRVTGSDTHIEPAYVVKGKDNKVLSSGAVLGHDEVAAAFTTAIEQSGVTALPLGGATASPLVSEVAARHAELTAALADVQAVRNRVLDQLQGDDVTGALLRELNRRFNDELDPACSKLQAEIDELDAADAAVGGSVLPAGFDVAAVLELAGVMQDPFEQEHRHLLDHAVRDLHLAVDRLTVEDGAVALRLTGRLRFGHHGGTYDAPIDRTWTTLPVKDRFEELVDLIAARGYVGALHGRRSLNRYGHLLCPDGGQIFLWQVTDERIAQAAFEVLTSGDESVEDVAARLGEPVSFVRRIALVHAPMPAGRRRWLGRGVVVPAMYRLAARQDGLVRYDQITSKGRPLSGEAIRVTLAAAGYRHDWTTERGVGLRTGPCGCGHWRRIPAAIPEPLGAVCASCRCDEAGIVWPRDPYDGLLLS